jgi:hypothetical protein
MDKASSVGLSMVLEEVREIDGWDEFEGDLSRELKIFAADEIRDFFDGLLVGTCAGKLDFRGAKLFGETASGSTGSAEVLQISGVRVAL